jgi:hypothetical protein
LYFFPRRARAERLQGGDRSAKTFHAKDPGEMKSIDRPGEVLVAFDVAPSLQDAVFEACRKDSPELLAQIQGVIVWDVATQASGRGTASLSAATSSGSVEPEKKGETFDAQLRFTERDRKAAGHPGTQDPISMPVYSGGGEATRD